MSFKLDLHLHSKFSGDNNSDPQETIIRAISLKLDGLAFTEHYFYEASEPVELLKSKYSQYIKIFRGVEFSSLEGHCLIFGVNTDLLNLKDLPFNDIVIIINEAGGVVIPSHPYRRVNSLGDIVKATSGLCALEGYNGCNMDIFNIKAVNTAKALRLPYTGGSDAHSPEEVGSCYTEFSERVTEENLVALLKAGNFRGIDTRKISKGYWKYGPDMQTP